ncbi:MAG: formate dehydrogenase accessory protein FdhE [Streptosporangiales bacterium]|nr:formate dehydrogenase accessory protein FdhE [Streptosporangiales bacterium]
MDVSRVETSPWAAPRQRAEALRDRHAFATEVLTLYLALLEVWEEAWHGARSAARAGPVPMPPEALPGWAAEHVLPRVVAATAESGPEPLVESLFPNPVENNGAGEELLAAWLAGDELVPVERYLARASLRGPLAAVDAGAACARDPSPRSGRRCPACGGPPQLSFRTDAGDHLVSGGRRLLCARCGESWRYSSSACASCGETSGGRRTIYAEQREGPQVGRGAPAGKSGDTTFPHIRVDGCASCERYLIDVDLGRDPRAVPEVDELSALPLDLYAAERGLSKITPNLMGF